MSMENWQFRKWSQIESLFYLPRSSKLGGGFNYFLFSPLFGEDFQFDYFSDGLKPATRKKVHVLHPSRNQPEISTKTIKPGAGWLWESRVATAGVWRNNASLVVGCWLLVVGCCWWWWWWCCGGCCCCCCCWWWWWCCCCCCLLLIFKHLRVGLKRYKCLEESRYTII